MSDSVQFSIAREGRRIFIKIAGSARYTNSMDFGRFVMDVLLQDEEWEDALLDLRETTYLDSTNLGLLAKISGRMLKKTGRRSVVVCFHPDVTALLKNTGFESIMRIVDRIDDVDDSEAEFKSLEGESGVERDAARIMLEAHRELMSLDGENERRFRMVVELLENDLAKDDE